MVVVVEVGVDDAHLPLEDPERRFDARVDRVGAVDEVGRGRDRDQSDRRHEPDDVAPDLALARAERDEDQGELADLRDRQSRLERHLLPVAHEPHDHHHDDRVPDEHEEREDDRGTDLVERGGEVEARPELDEEEHEHEVAQRRESPTDGVPVRRRREGDAGEERADLLAEPEQDRDGGERDGPRHRTEDQQLRLACEQRDHAVGDVAPEEHHEPDQQRAAEHDLDRARADRRVTVTARGDHDHREHDDDVLDDEETDRDAAVQVVDLALVGQQLDDDDRRGERQRDRDVQRRDGGEAERDRDEEPDDGREEHLAEAGRECDGTEPSDQPDVELQPDDEQQQRDPELREQLDVGRVVDEAEGLRADGDPGGDQPHDERLAQYERSGPRDHADEEDRGDLLEDPDLHVHPSAPARCCPRRPATVARVARGSAGASSGTEEAHPGGWASTDVR